MMSKTTHFGFETVDEKDKARRVAGVFTSVASKYDIMNDLMSAGLHRIWIPGTDLRSWDVNAAGRLVVLSADTTVTGRFDVVAINHDGTGLRTVATPPAGSAVSFVKFSPSGVRIMYETKDTTTLLEHLFVVNTAGGQPLDVTPPKAVPTDPTLNIINTTWSRDSRYLAIVAESTSDRLNELWVVDLSQPSPAPVNLISSGLTGAPGLTGFWGVTSGVEWSAASRSELIFKYRTVTNTAFHLMQISPTGANFVPVAGTPDGVTLTGYIGSFGLSPNGLSVAFAADSALQQAYEVYVVSLVNGPPSTRVSAGTATASLRPNFNRALVFNGTGAMLAFGANYDVGGNQYEPYALPLPGGPQVRLSPLVPGGNIDDLAWSPDSTQLAFVSDWRTDETFELALATSLTSTSTPTSLVAPVVGGDVLDVQWTP